VGAAREVADMTTRTLLATVALLALAALAAAQSPIGPSFQVNEITAGKQGYWHGPNVAADAAGNFVVIWETRYEYPNTISARRFDASGAALGPELAIATEGSSQSPAVASDPTGNFVVVWEDDATALGDDDGIVARRYDSAGAPLGPEFLVNTYTTGFQSNPKVASDAAGNFVVVWHQYDFYGYGLISGQRFDSSGAPLGSEFQVNSYTTGTIGYGLTIAEDADGIEVAAGPAGNFMVAWSHYDNRDGDANGIFARAFDSSGAPIGPDFQVNEYTTYEQQNPDVVADGAGNFVVVWGGFGVGGGGVNARRFASTGAPVGGEFNVSSAFYLATVNASAGPTGDFVVVWSDYYTTHGRQFDSSGGALAPDFTIAPLTYPYYDTLFAAVATQPAGDFVVVWQERYRDGDSDGIFAQRFTPPTGPCSPAPRTDCRERTIAGRGVLLLDAGATPAKDRLVWRWVKGEASAPADLGDPFDTTNVAFCLYDASGAAQPILDAVAPAGGTCRERPCWRTLGAAQIEYLDPETDPDGLRRLRLTPGPDGDAFLTVVGKGANLGLPAGPLSLPVTAQVQTADGECWSATYQTLVRRNEVGLFRANPD
jgi:hypothetical protein